MIQFFKNKKILIAGGSGFVGTNLIKELSKYNCKLKATYLKKKKIKKFKNVNYLKADFQNKKDCNKVCKNVDLLIIASAISSGAGDMQNRPLIHLTPNLIINTLLLEAAYKNNVKHVVFISSSTVYPDGKKIMVETSDNFKFFNKYFIVGWMKKFSEILCEMYSCKINHKMKCTIIRPSNIYGPYDKFELDKAKVIPALINKISSAKKKLYVWGDGKDIKDFIFIDDFVNATLKIIAKQKKMFDIYNVSQGKSVSLKKIINILKKISNKEYLKVNYDITKPTMIPIRKISSNKIKNFWKPKYELSDGLKKTYMWFNQNKK
tara:strand:+ start:198 stop:1157 length:960 start_codon:yes stop_codon:yes gene_type:complete